MENEKTNDRTASRKGFLLKSLDLDSVYPTRVRYFCPRHKNKEKDKNKFKENAKRKGKLT